MKDRSTAQWAMDCSALDRLIGLYREAARKADIDAVKSPPTSEELLFWARGQQEIARRG